MAAEPEETRALVLQPNVGMELTSAPDESEWRRLVQMANAIAKARGFVPAHFTSDPSTAAFKVLAAIMYGRELGIPPMQSLSQIRVIDGKPSMSAELMAARVWRSGHKIVGSTSTTKAEVTITRRGGESHTVTWTIEDAKRAGLVKQGSGWEKYPQSMLWARALSQCARECCPDVLMGASYTPEELEDTRGPEPAAPAPGKLVEVEFREVGDAPAPTGEIAPEAASQESKAAVEVEGQDTEEVASAATSGAPASPPRRRGVGPKPKRQNVVSPPPQGDASEAARQNEAPPAGAGDHEASTAQVDQMGKAESADTSSPLPSDEPTDDGERLFELRQRARRSAAKLRRTQITLRNKRAPQTGLPVQEVPANDDATNDSDESLKVFIESRTPGKALEQLTEPDLEGLIETLEGLTQRKEAELGAPPQ